MRNRFLYLPTGTGVLLSWLLVSVSPVFSKADQNEVTIPLNMGVGPEINYYNGGIGKEQLFHYGLKLDIHAFIDKEVLDKNRNRVPPQWRRQVKKLSSVKISKIYIPESIIISPKTKHTGMYGINFRPMSAGLGLASTPALDVNLTLGVNLTYLFIHSDSLFAGERSEVMHFLRPGINAKLNFQFKISREFQLSTGLEGIGYVPQEMSPQSKIAEVGDFSDENLWLMGQLYFLVNIRIPKKVTL